MGGQVCSLGSGCAALVEREVLSLLVRFRLPDQAFWRSCRLWMLGCYFFKLQPLQPKRQTEGHIGAARSALTKVTGSLVRRLVF